MRLLYLSLLLISFLSPHFAAAQEEHSVAREWVEVLLEGIRNDKARPTVHARNLFHTSAAMYDGWAIYDDTAHTYFLGQTVRGFRTPYTAPATPPADLQAAREMTISYAAYRIIMQRFSASPGTAQTSQLANQLMAQLGYSTAVAGTDYQNGGPAELGNYLAQQILAYGAQDGSNEALDFANARYTAVNDPLPTNSFGVPGLTNFNRWQPLAFDVFIDQSGQVSSGTTPDFLGAEWGKVAPFALRNNDLKVFSDEQRGDLFWVYHDPGPPPYFGLSGENTQELADEYRWNFELVSKWSSHLDPSDGVMWDISPGAQGNVPSYPDNFVDYRDFYDEYEGGDSGQGRPLNPVTGQPYAPNIVPRGDYTRVLAEFWADGPASETPPGHWFTILNYVHDHPLFERRFAGGEVLPDLEWDVKAYLALAGAMHDAAITTWGIKGYYDYIRPISALRNLALIGQRTDPAQPNYNPLGINLSPGFIEIIQPGDPLAGFNNINAGLIKVRAWRGPNAVINPETDVAGVDWILGGWWLPYQRSTFVTPNFAGYLSGHSTFSSAAAEVLTRLTGTEYFPGGMGEFVAPQNEFLVFEEGPSQDIVLQWATYRDASDQTSLSRIWGGIHPPADDIKGRKIGRDVGNDAFDFANRLFVGQSGPDFAVIDDGPIKLTILGNPVRRGGVVRFTIENRPFISPTTVDFYDLSGRRVYSREVVTAGSPIAIPTSFARGVHLMVVRANGESATAKLLVQ